MIKINPDIIKIIDLWVDYKWRSNKTAGVSIGIVSNNKTVFKKGYGYKNLVKKAKTGPLTTYRIASISKVFTALGILKLVQNKKIGIDDAVVKYLPEFNSGKEHSKITIRQLLNHKSLLTRDGSYGQWETGKFPTAKQLLKQAEKNIVFSAAETGWKYSNFGYSLLGLIIEKVTGQSYEDFVQKHFIKPLRLKHTSSVLNRVISDSLATGYVPENPSSPQKEIGQYETYAMAAATGFSSNTTDLIEFLKAIINKSPKLLNKKSWDLAYKTQWSSKEDQRNLFLWNNKKTKRDGHGGGFPGFASRISLDTKNKLGVVVLINLNPSPSAGYLKGIYSIIDHSYKLQKKLSKFKKKPKATIYEGQFKNLWGVVQVSSVNGQLIAFELNSQRPTEEAALFEYKGNDTFIIHDEDGFGSNGESVKFIFSKNKKLVGMDWAGHYHSLVK